MTYSQLRERNYKQEKEQLVDRLAREVPWSYPRELLERRAEKMLKPLSGLNPPKCPFRDPLTGKPPKSKYDKATRTHHYLEGDRLGGFNLTRIVQDNPHLDWPEGFERFCRSNTLHEGHIEALMHFNKLPFMRDFVTTPDYEKNGYRISFYLLHHQP